MHDFAGTGARPLALRDPRVAIAVALAAQLAALRWLSVGRFRPLSTAEGGTAELLLALHTGAKALLLALLLLGLAAWRTGRLSGPAALAGPARGVTAGLNLAAFAALAAVIAGLPAARPDGAPLPADIAAAYGRAIALMLTWQLSAAALLLGRDTLRGLTPREIGYGALLAAGSAAYFDLELGGVSTHDLFRRLVEGTTLTLSLAAHAVMSPQPASVVMDGDVPLIFSERFAIRLGAPCAGYRGMLTTLLLLGGVAALEGSRLRPLRTAALVAGAVALVFVMNSVRIALLFRLGETISPEVAVNGFHNQFGALSLLTVAAAAAVLMQTAPFRRAAAAGPRPALGGLAWPSARAVSDAAAMTAPLAVLMLAGMLAGLFAGEFDWFYPAATLAGGAAILATRARLIPELAAPSPAGPLVGVAVYAAWILMVQEDAERTRLLRETLAAAPGWAAALWIAFRVFGSSVVVPVVEEMAIRGGLMRLIDAVTRPALPGRLSLAAAVVVSSTAFALLHVDVAAALVAGLAYGALAAWRGAIGDAVVAHAVTNFMIALHVLALGEWHLW